MWQNDNMQTNPDWDLSNLEKLNVVICHNAYADGWITIAMEDSEGQVRTEMHSLTMEEK